MKTCQIAPSILSADFSRLGDEARAVVAGGADLVHFDVVDNHYVPNLTIGPMVCAALKPHVSVPIDVHLMVRPVDRLASDFAKAGAAIVTFHPEASDHVDRTIAVIHDSGCKAGLALNPGFGGQSFITEALNKLALARSRIDAVTARTGREIRLEVDGGVKIDNIASIAKAGADTFVAGSAIFGGGDYKKIIAALRAAATGA